MTQPSPAAVLSTQQILTALNKYVTLGLISYVATSDPVGEQWSVGVGGEPLTLDGNGEATVWLNGVSAGLDWARTFLVQAGLNGQAADAPAGERGPCICKGRHGHTDPSCPWYGTDQP